jgi:hypothetical protein
MRRMCHCKQCPCLIVASKAFMGIFGGSSSSGPVAEQRMRLGAALLCVWLCHAVRAVRAVSVPVPETKVWRAAPLWRSLPLVLHVVSELFILRSRMLGQPLAGRLSTVLSYQDHWQTTNAWFSPHCGARHTAHLAVEAM